MYTCRFVGGGGGAAAEGREEKGERERGEDERRGRKLQNDECGVREGVGDTSVCISAAKLPFEAGGKEDTGKKEGGQMGKREKKRKGCERRES